MILPYASKPLRSAILRNEECERRSKGICYIDFDVIINGQAWSLSELHLTDETDAKTHGPVVRANFINFNKQRVSYFFVQENKTWKIDDVETEDYKKDGKAEAPFYLKKQLLRSDI